MRWSSAPPLARSPVRWNRLEEGEAVEAGHLHVEEDELGRALGDHAQRLLAVTRFADELDVGVVVEEAA